MKIENGNANPSLNTLLKLANGLGKKLQVSLV
ncbi:MAG: helix-turn-helix transcriptional regulator [Succinivibrio sp.]|nr:helix-turn-helix transcriptional regulator [Succinivibrio sp.]